MPVDTRDKRNSAIYLTQPWRSMIPNPDATVSQPDRQHVPWLYSGITAAGGAAPTLLLRMVMGMGR